MRMIKPVVAVVVVLTIAGMATAGTDGASQTKNVVVTATADAGGRHYEASGTGECHAATDASIYDNPAAMTSAMLSASRSSMSQLNVTIWQLKKGSEIQVTLTTTLGATTYEIATVKGAPIKGAATARVDRRGAGGTITVDGRTAAGAALRVSVTCPAFTPPEDNG